jgi:hypothetical protein
MQSINTWLRIRSAFTYIFKQLLSSLSLRESSKEAGKKVGLLGAPHVYPRWDMTISLGVLFVGGCMVTIGALFHIDMAYVPMQDVGLEQKNPSV